MVVRIELNVITTSCAVAVMEPRKAKAFGNSQHARCELYHSSQVTVTYCWPSNNRKISRHIVVIG